MSTSLLRPTGAPAHSDSFQTSGSSPGSRRVHLIGLGPVGRAFVSQAPAHGFSIVALSDSAATIYAKEGFAPAELAAVASHKAAGRPLADYPGAARLRLEVALTFVAADLVADAATTDFERPELAVERIRWARRVGSRVAVAGKDALAVAAERVALAGERPAVGIHAALGGTGRALQAQQAELARRCTSLALVANASTTFLLEARAAGADPDSAKREARALGWLEGDGAADLSGWDGALKLAGVARLVLGWRGALAELPLVSESDLDDAAGLGRSGVRLVGRARRDRRGQVEFTLRYEALAKGHPLRAPLGTVAYSYTLDDGRTVVHLGDGIGPERTALALIEDLQALRDVAGGAA